MMCKMCQKHELVEVDITVGIASVTIHGRCPLCGQILDLIPYRIITLTQEFKEGIIRG